MPSAPSSRAASWLTVEVPAKRRLRWWVKLSVALIAVLVLELGFRLMGFGPTVLYEPGLQYGYRVAPDQTARWFWARTRVNQFGMRAPDRPLVKSAGTLRILLIGDSTLWGGIYIDQDDLYARRLEGLLAERVGAPVEIWNIAANGWGPLHLLGYVERFGAYDADVAVVCMPIDDLHRPLSQLDAFPFFRKKQPPSCAIEEVLYILLWRYRHGQLLPSQVDDRDWSIARGIDTCGQLTEKLEALGCEVLFEVLPSRAAAIASAPPAEEAEHFAALAAKLESLRIPVGYALEVLGDHTESALYHDPGHLSAAGHEVYAAYLAERLMAVSEKCGRVARPADASSKKD